MLDRLKGNRLRKAPKQEVMERVKKLRAWKEKLEQMEDKD